MSSIAYVSDEKMLEFHRLNANSSMNFWRLSLKNFERFTIGDLLFFIDKRNPHPITKEKGVIGYGRATQMRTMSVRRMWEQFDQENGYPTYDSFKSAILGYGTDETLPKQIQSIYLEDVTFFQAPVYMSEIDVQISKRLESFTYLEYKQSMKLIQKGNDHGLDPWTQMMNPQRVNHQKIIDEQILRQTLERINVNWTQSQEKIMNQVDAVVRLGNFGYRLNSNEAEIYIPVSSIKNQFYELIGIISVLKHELKDLNIKCSLVSKTSLEPFESILVEMNVELVYI